MDKIFLCGSVDIRLNVVVLSGQMWDRVKGCWQPLLATLLSFASCRPREWSAAGKQEGALGGYRQKALLSSLSTHERNTVGLPLMQRPSRSRHVAPSQTYNITP